MEKIFNKKRLAALLALSVLLLSMAGGAAYAKYVRDYTLKDNSVTITASLGDIALAGPPETYLLIPGHDFPLNYTVTISNKTSIAAYLFIEVTGGPSQVTYIGTENWKKLAIDGRNVFVYKDQLTKGSDGPINVDILAQVSQEIKGESNADVTLNAYLGQVYEVSPGITKTPEEVFTELLATP